MNPLRKRRDFLAANRGERAVTPGFILLMRDREDEDPAIRFGITVTKKIGGAVVRNRMKRRFRELARAILPFEGRPGADYVMIGRAGGVERDFAALRSELSGAVRKVSVNAEPVEARLSAEKRPSTGSGLTD